MSETLEWKTLAAADPELAWKTHKLSPQEFEDFVREVPHNVLVRVSDLDAFKEHTEALAIASAIPLDDRGWLVTSTATIAKVFQLRKLDCVRGVQFAEPVHLIAIESSVRPDV